MRERVIVTVAPAYHRDASVKLPDTVQFFSGAGGGVDVKFTLPDGTSLTEMDSWSMAALNQKDNTLRNALASGPRNCRSTRLAPTFVPQTTNDHGFVDVRCLVRDAR